MGERVLGPNELILKKTKPKYTEELDDLPTQYEDYLNSVNIPSINLEGPVDINSLFDSLKENLDNLLNNNQKEKLLSLLRIDEIKNNNIIKKRLVQIDYLLDLKSGHQEDLKKQILLLLFNIQGVLKNKNPDFLNIYQC